MSRPTLRDAVDLAYALAVEYHQTGSIRDHSDPYDRTGWNVKGIETCEDALCVEALAMRVALDTEDVEAQP